MTCEPYALRTTTHSYQVEGEQTLVNRFLGLDAYEWFVTVAGFALIGLATWWM
jgi:hypothetical protein